jgi:hypothetical protein
MMAAMSFLFLGLTGLFMVATLVTLGVGIVGMGQGGEFNRRYSNKLMRLRVLFQALAVGSFVLFLMAR